jgi:MoaA/NifB/PqqE/SkfB family radical SAM enzyme
MRLAVEGICELNKHAFVRISGSIGEPLAHPDIVSLLSALNSREMSWGLTTNGLLLHKQGVMCQSLLARYVHISVDCGSDATYAELKGGSHGDYGRVLRNIGAFTDARRQNVSSARVVVSMVLQSESFRELPILSIDAKRVGADVLEVKMQHFDERLTMSADEVIEAYQLLESVRRRDVSAEYRVVAVQDERSALGKLNSKESRIRFRRCWASILGLSGTLDAHGMMQPCCQYFDRTLPSHGFVGDGLAEVWRSDARRRALRIDPRTMCHQCSPSDEWINSFVELVCSATEEDPEFLAWAERTVVNNPTYWQ